MDHGGEAVIGFVAAQGYSLKVLEFAEEILDQMPPFVDLFVNLKGFCASRMLRNDDFGAALIEVFDDPVRIEGLIGNEPLEFEAFDQRRNANRVVTMPRQQLEAHEIAECIGQRQDLGG